MKFADLMSRVPYMEASNYRWKRHNILVYYSAVTAIRFVVLL